MQGLVVEIPDDTDDPAFLIRSKCLENRADSFLWALEPQPSYRLLKTYNNMDYTLKNFEIVLLYIFQIHQKKQNK
jgi:hypothetical protein